MFDIARDACGQTCNADELVRGKSEAEIGSARKRKYFCVACVDEKHPVFLNVRHEVGALDKKARNNTALAWFSHHGSGGMGGGGRDRPSPETAKHWQAKHILSQHVGRYKFTASQCKSCNQHTTTEDGAGAIGKVELSEMTSGGGVKYRFDAALLCGELVRSVLEVWATHETSEEKRRYCLDQGYMFGEFDADAVVEAHQTAPENSVYELENLKIRVFECGDCAVAREQAAIRAENARLLGIAMAEEARLLRLSMEAQRKQQQLEEDRAKREEAEKQMDQARRKFDEEKKHNDALHAKSLDDAKRHRDRVQESYEKWEATQVDRVKARKKRDEESHLRWISARDELRKKTKI